ncbi:MULTISPECIES: nucleoside/nucleotide kinase family protein [unclassified Arthrobacter]|uniref:nucleoside/nucleotide kinase family protein n=1 Tax=unclassified Arthrobacter TaxID=235627 RepID=UPI00159E9024|nr:MULTISPECIES: nucleoside/nucleotide kinase family protein [unclassified Arthrobacter]MCQ9165223.1 nucleoside/nucleotide kinase family protein [Arthrobacter sp. STN4]NVM98043.1 nucleoside/nucleotide kinase family protein [Arthrobacter sp. SDTb3-6]
MTTTVHLEDLIASAGVLAATGGRAILGITGPPGAGKSTVGSQIVDALGPDKAVLVPMDGFHLSNAVLLAKGLRQVKGAIQTFDDAGYANLIQRIRGQKSGEVIYAPSFNRDLEEPIAGSIPVLAEVPLVVTEGNYLLAESGAWPSARDCLTESWFLNPAREHRHNWLISRHMDYGKSAADARLWALGSDEDNARLIESMSHRADRVLRLTVK